MPGANIIDIDARAPVDIAEIGDLPIIGRIARGQRGGLTAGAFGIGVMKPDGSGERIITEGYHNEGPTWAPNGLYLMFFRDPGGQAGPKMFMTDVYGRGEFPVATPGFASDPSWGPLLK